MPARAGALVVGLGVALLLAGCTGDEDAVPPLPSMAAEPDLYRPTLEPEYRIALGDELLVQSYYVPSVKQQVMVRGDGRISLDLLANVSAAGRTTADLGRELARDYGRFAQPVDITVSVISIARSSVAVSGQVRRPALVAVRGQITLLQSIAAAAGLLPSADARRVLVLRAGPDRRYHACRVDVTAVLSNHVSEPYLRRGDVVYVPKSDIARLDEFVDTYINQIVPPGFSLQIQVQSLQAIR